MWTAGVLFILWFLRTLPALVKVVSPPDGQSGILQVSSFEGDITRASSWSLLEWVEKSTYGLLSEFTADNFSRFILLFLLSHSIFI